MEYEIGQTESVSTAIVRAVSAVKGREPCSLRPLAYVLDPDALDVLFESRSNGQPGQVAVSRSSTAAVTSQSTTANISLLNRSKALTEHLPPDNRTVPGLTIRPIVGAS